jgi:hypothetical protein
MQNPAYLTIVWQAGPVKEAGVNGVQAPEVIGAVIQYLQGVNVPPHANRETSLAITKLEEAVLWLNERTRRREARGVEGTSQV